MGTESSTLPVGRAIGQPVAGAPSAVPRRRCRIFVAEDDDELRAVLVAAFRRDGCEVVEATDGPELVERLVDANLAGHPLAQRDVVISDLRMPGFTGLQLLASFHGLRWRTPFVLISAFVDRATEERARKLGAAAVFSKPFAVDELRAVVLRLLAPPPAGEEYDPDR